MFYVDADSIIMRMVRNNFSRTCCFISGFGDGMCRIVMDKSSIGPPFIIRLCRSGILNEVRFGVGAQTVEIRGLRNLCHFVFCYVHFIFNDYMIAREYYFRSLTYGVFIFWGIIWCNGCASNQSPRILLSQHVFNTSSIKLRPAEPLDYEDSAQLANVNNYCEVDFFASISNDTDMEWQLPDGRDYNGYNTVGISVKTKDGLVHDIVMTPRRVSSRPLTSATVISPKTCLTIPISLFDPILRGVPFLNVGEEFEVRVAVRLGIVEKEGKKPVFVRINSGWHLMNYQQNKTIPLQ